MIRCLSLIPSNMVNGREECIEKFNKIVEKLYQKGHLRAKAAYDKKVQFIDFANTVVVQHRKQFLNFDYSKQRLHHFCHTFLNRNEKYKDFWGMMSSTLSHGQSEIERGFSVNKETVI